MDVRVRFAPSPTGFVHIGSLRTALYNYLVAKQKNGKYILRIEDTDRNRKVEGAIEGMLDAMEWAHVSHDEGAKLIDGKLTEVGALGPYTQSERLPIYKEHIEILLVNKSAYHCFCSKERIDELREEQKSKGLTPRYDKKCLHLSKEETDIKINAGEQHVIRLNLPIDRDIKFKDIVRGEVIVNTDDLDDQVLMKSDGYPTYHFAVVVDDYLMKISHIIRGEEWLISTPKHIFLYEAFGWEIPQYVHLPNILNEDKKKLSKRQGDVAVEDFMRKGYLPEALINYIALVGWSPEDNQEIFTMEELIEKFSLERISKSGGVFDVNKLNWVNAHYIKESSIERITDMAVPHLIEKEYITEQQASDNYEWIKDMVSVFKDRLSFVAEIVEEVNIFLNNDIDIEEQEAVALLNCEHVPQLLEVLTEKIKNAEEIDLQFGKKVFKEIQKETGIKGAKLFKPARVIFTGKTHGPDMPLVMKVLGKKNLLARIENAKKFTTSY